MDADSIRLQVQGLIEKAEELLRQDTWQSADSALHVFASARELSERTFGKEDTSYLDARYGVARCYFWRGDIDIADSLMTGSLQICQAFLDPDHPVTAYTEAAIALILWLEGRQGEAIPIIERAVRKLEQTSTYRNRYYEALRSLWLFRYNQQRWSEFDSLYPVVLSVCTSINGPVSRECAYVFEVKGLEYCLQSKTDEAEAMALKAITIYHHLFGPGQKTVQYAYDVLARVYHQKGEWDKAEELERRQLTIADQQLGPFNRRIVELIRNLVNMLQGRAHSHEDWEEIEGLARRAQRICSSSWFTFCQPLQDLLCAACGINGKYDTCLAAFNEEIAGRLKIRDNTFSYASESLKLHASKHAPVIVSPFISFAEMHGTPAVRSDALAMILKGRAQVLDAVAAERKAAFCSEDDTLRSLTAMFESVSGQISNLSLVNGSQAYNKKMDDSLRILYKTQDRLETEMSERCAEFQREMQKRDVTVADVARALPEGSALLEYIEYRPFKFEPVPIGRNWDSPAYGVFVLDAASGVEFVRLGEARVVDSLVAECREKIQEATQSVYYGGEAAAAKALSTTTNELYRLVFAPVEQVIGHCDRLFICPDAQLDLIPFEILTLPDGKYAVEKYNISYLSSGRDLLNYQDAEASPSGNAMVLAEPDYDNPSSASPIGHFAQVENSAFQVQTRGPTDRGECLTDLFSPLPATATEGQQVAQLLSDEGKYSVKAYYGDMASERVLKDMDVPPGVLHIATHGYFCPKASFSSDSPLTENPLLYSGLALAGANRTIAHENEDSAGQAVDDGILTSLEASALNLSGTELLVLSSCNSGVGDLQEGVEGVYGLRRAFQLAGARSMLVSAFSVPDQATSRLMNQFYHAWLSGKPKYAALRTAELQLLNERRNKLGYAHPIFWGGFILLGDPN